MDTRYPNEPSQYYPQSITIEKPPSQRLTPVFITLLVITVIAILVAIVAYRIIPRRNSGTSVQPDSPDNGGGSGGGGGGGGGGGVITPTGCQSNMDCPTVLPVCDLTTNGCVQCLTTPDCLLGYECSGTKCCYSGAPVVTGIVTMIDGDASVTVSYTHGPTFIQGSTVEVSILTSTGVELIAKTFTANGSNTIFQSELPGVVKYFFTTSFPAVGYAARVRIKYSCGALDNVFTPYSAIFPFTMQTCFTTQYIDKNAIYTSPGSGTPEYTGMVVAHFQTTVPTVNSYFIGTTNSFHPNLPTWYYGNVTTRTGPNLPDNQQFAALPSTGSPGQLLYVRYFTHGNGSTCNSALTPYYPYTV